MNSLDKGLRNIYIFRLGYIIRCFSVHKDSLAQINFQQYYVNWETITIEMWEGGICM